MDKLIRLTFLKRKHKCEPKMDGFPARALVQPPQAAAWRARRGGRLTDGACARRLDNPLALRQDTGD